MIDALLESLYIQKEEHSTVYSILRSKNIEIENMDIIWDKVNNLNLFGKKTVTNSDTYRDMMITPNAEGYEFVQKYKSYSNYLDVIASEQKKAKDISYKNNIGTYLGGIGSFLAFIISIFSLVNSYVNNESPNKELKHSIDSIKIELEKVIQLNEKRLKKD
jgi:hypothetical protein